MVILITKTFTATRASSPHRRLKATKATTTSWMLFIIGSHKRELRPKNKSEKHPATACQPVSKNSPGCTLAHQPVGAVPLSEQSWLPKHDICMITSLVKDLNLSLHPALLDIYTLLSTILSLAL